MVGTAPTSKPADPPLAFTGQTLGLCNSARRTSGLASESQILTGSSAHLQCSACRPPISIYLFECLGPAIVLGQTICAISLASPHRHSAAVFSHLKAYLRFGALQAASPAGRRSQNSIFYLSLMDGQFRYLLLTLFNSSLFLFYTPISIFAY